MSSSIYRSDIDGMRAIAVVSVIIFHINQQWLPGGFVGVDIFFVISGYLISKHLFAEMSAGTFRFADFYQRRIKRIAPASLLVISVTVLVSQLVLLPVDAERVAESALWSLFSLANVYFWLSNDSGYFAASSDEIPLLHLWSLGVEEQFYLIWPLVLFLCFSYFTQRRFVLALVVAIVASFSFGYVVFNYDAAFAYYMLPSRVGELLLGAIVARQEMLNRLAGYSDKVLSFARYLGFVLIVLSTMLINKNMNFPGYLAAFPAVGTALLILPARKTDILSAFLSLRLLTFIGLLSYSAYLWHWPVLAILRYGGIQLDAMVALICLLSTFTLAWLSYRFVELPCRQSKHSFLTVLRRQMLVPTFFVAASCVFFMKIDGYGIQLWDEAYKAALAQDRYKYKQPWEYDNVCQQWQLNVEMFDKDRCLINGGEKADKTVLLWGDSNAAHYVGVFAPVLQQFGMHLKNISVSACPPLFSDPQAYVNARNYAQCYSSLSLIEQHIDDYDVVILSASWPSYVERQHDFMQEFEHTLAALRSRGIRVVLAGKVPIFDDYQRDCSIRALRYPAMECRVNERQISQNILAQNQALKALANQYANVFYMDINDMLCNEDGICSIYASDGMALYIDKSHLAISSSWQLGGQILQDKDKMQQLFKIFAD